jgi:prepilin-type processing-associated H-X9-DG protein
MPTSSYAAALAFHVYSLSAKTGIMEAVADRIALPNNYVPRCSNIGNCSSKIFAMDGTRFIDSKTVSFNSFAKQIQGGNYMIYGPVICQSGDPYLFGSYSNPTFDKNKIAETYAFRHEKKMNAVFFDGHVESLGIDKALNVSLYWPRGSVVKASKYTYDTGDKDSQVIY